VTGDDKAVSKFKLANLIPGDILFCTDPDGRESKAIRTATGSPFSHAAIYKGELNFLEAADYGVSNFNYLRFGIASIEVERSGLSIENHGPIGILCCQGIDSR